MNDAAAILDAETPKAVFKAAVAVPPPPRGLLQQAIDAKAKYLKKPCQQTSVATNPRGETFCYGEFGYYGDIGPRGPIKTTTSTLLFYDKHVRRWVPVDAGTFAEAAEDPKSVFKAVTGRAIPSPDRGKFVRGGNLRRLVGRYPATGVYIWMQKGKFPYGEGILQIKLHNYGLIRDEWASFGVLCNSLLNWRNLEGAPLYIDGKPADKVSRRHPELVKIANDTWRPGAGHMGAEAVAEAEDPKAFLKRMSREAEHGSEYHIGFAIDTGDEYFLTDNAHEHDIETTPEFWDQIGQDSLKLEGNLLQVLHELGIQTRAEGHGGDNSLVGSAWVTVGTPGYEALKRWAETDGEFLHYENLEDCCPNARALLWHNITPEYAPLFMPRIDFFDYKEVPGIVEEGRKSKSPLGADPKAFFKRMISTGKLGRTQAYAQVLEYMPPDFVEAFQKKQHAEWHQDDFSFTDNWPTFDDDRADEGENPWSQVFYYFEYETDQGKIDLIVMEGDLDGNHDIVEAAEVGTPEADRLMKEYGAEGWFKAMEAYWQWVVDHGSDPLGYIHLPQVEVVAEFLLGFVKEAERMKLALVRQLTAEKPSPPPVSFEEAWGRAAADPKWKDALEYALVDQQGYTEATEEQIVAEGGKWDKQGRLVLRYIAKSKENAPNEEEFIRTKAQEALAQLQRDMRAGHER